MAQLRRRLMFRTHPTGESYPVGLPYLYSKPTPFEQEVIDILSGEKDFYLQWQKAIAEATSDEELRGLARDIIASNRSDSAKKIVLQLIDRQYDLIRRIKGVN